jgi:hypothetical protein
MTNARISAGSSRKGLPRKWSERAGEKPDPPGDGASPRKS